MRADLAALPSIRPGIRQLAGLLGVLFATAAAAELPHSSEYVYAGSWNNISASAAGEVPLGVYGWRIEEEGGPLVPLGLVARTVNSADSLAARRDGRVLYVTEYNGCICTRSWPFPGAPRPTVAAFAVSPATGKLTFLNRVDGLGDMPAEITVSSDGRTLALANYYGGNVVTFRLDKSGAIGAAASNIVHSGTSVHASAGPHPHGLAFSSDGSWLYVADQGLDRVYVYRVDRTTSAISQAPTPYLQFDDGSGPRHVSVHPNGRWMYVITEQGGQVYQLARGKGGRLSRLSGASIVKPGSPIKLGGAQSRVSPDGRFLYVSHRPNEDMAVFRIDPANGGLTLVQFAETSARAAKSSGTAVPFGEKPLWDKVETGARAFAWTSDASRIVSANLGENALVTFKRDGSTGRLSEHATITSAAQPSFVLVVKPR